MAEYWDNGKTQVAVYELTDERMLELVELFGWEELEKHPEFILELERRGLDAKRPS